MTQCPCGSGKTFHDCCEPIITEQQPAATAEQLMRARYSAHEKAAITFLYQSTHPAQRNGYDQEATKSWAEESEWLGLEIVETSGGAEEDSEGTVTFVARFRDKNGLHNHHECGQFTREDGRWFFTQGTRIKEQPISVNKVGRNTPCPCGSGLKYKKCCGK